MRFGSHSHDVDRKPLDPIRERIRIVRALRDITDRIEKAPLDGITESLAFIAAALEPLVRLVDRTLGHRQ